MKFKSITARNKRTGWNVKNIQFNSMLTLLVGASGVGKTKILNIIKTLTKIANGESFNGLAWKVEFEQEGIDYVWEGEFDTNEEIQQSFLDEKENKYKIVRERIFEKDSLLVDRSLQTLTYKNQDLIKLDNTQSVVELLKAEPSIKPIYEGFNRCYDLDTADNSVKIAISSLLNAKIDKSIILAKSFYLSPMERLFLHHENKDKVYDVILSKFQSIFPNIEKMDFVLKKGLADYSLLVLRIKEKNVSSWIEQPDISSGMMRTLIQIITLVLANDGDIFMIDEFENGLGVNCINELADLVMEPEANIQVVMTSHHPYIINAIPVKNWKILTRNGSDVHVQTAEELHIGEHSKHEAFMQLLQTPEYKTGTRN